MITHCNLQKKDAYYIATSREEIEKLGIEWCYVPAGSFTMGAEDEYSSTNERPQHEVYLDEYHISKYEITNAQYCAFLNAYGKNSYRGHICIDLSSSSCMIYKRNGRYYVRRGYENHPVVGVSWYGAKAFCDYYGWELPTEAQWEKAARGTDRRRYPWGNHEPYYNKEYYANYDQMILAKDGYSTTAPVTSFPQGRSPYGCYNMAGNVWEWCNDWYDENYYSYSPLNNPEGPAYGTEKVLRGGSYGEMSTFIRCTCRTKEEPYTTHKLVGFRPVKK